MNKKNKKVLTWCLVVCMILTQMLFTNLAFAETRYQGGDRYETAAKVATTGWTTSDFAILATGEDYPDALCAAPLAKAYDAPILLTEGKALNSFAKDALTKLGVKKVFVVGGPGAVSEDVVSALTGIDAIRIWGTDRYDTSLQIAKSLKSKLGTIDSVFLATGSNFADALSASPIAAAKGMPILLAEKDTISEDVLNFIDGRKVYVAGGAGVISNAVANKFNNVVRLGGVDRYYTNVEIMDEFKADLNFDNVFLATGETYPDALAGSVLAAKKNAPLVLVASGINSAQKAFLAVNLKEGTTVVTLGGTGAVSSAAVAGLEGLVPSPLKVVSAVALNYQLVQVKFNKELAAIDKADFAFDNGIEVLDAQWGVDHKTVNITTTTQTRGFNYSIIYKGGSPMAVQLLGTTGVYNSKIKITPADAAALQISIYNQSDNGNRADTGYSRGERTFTVNIDDLIGYVNVALLPAEFVSFDEDGKPYFQDEHKVDWAADRKDVDAFIERINGVPVHEVVPNQLAQFVRDIPVPSNGVITVTTDCYGGYYDEYDNWVDVTNDDVRLIVWQDANHDAKLDVDDDDYPTEVVGVGGETAWYTASGAYSDYFVAGDIAWYLPEIKTFALDDGTKFTYKSTDTFQYLGNDPITMAEFETILDARDRIEITYNPKSTGKSTFNIVKCKGFKAPDEITLANTNADNGSIMNDVKVTFDEPANNNENAVYVVWRASTAGPNGHVGDSDDYYLDPAEASIKWVKLGNAVDGEYVDKNVANGHYFYKVTVTHPVSEDVETVYCSANVDPVSPYYAYGISVPLGELTRPEILWATYSDAVTRGKVDKGDVWQILFNEKMNLVKGDVLQVAEGYIFAGGELEYADIVLGTGNTFTTTVAGSQTLLTITFTATPKVLGLVAGDPLANPDDVLEYDNLAIVDETGVTDYYGNDLEFGERVAYILDRDDKNDFRPEIASVTSDANNNVILTFSEPIDRASATLEGNYLLRDSRGDLIVEAAVVGGGDPVDGISASWITVTITTNRNIDFSTLEIAQTVKDLQGNVGDGVYYGF